MTTTTYTLTIEDDSTLTVSNARNRVKEYVDDQVEVVKVDQSKNELNGAEFTLYADDHGNEVIKTFTAGHGIIATSDEELLEYLPAFEDDVDEGELETTFYLKETKAPDGYNSDDSVYEIHVKATRATDWNEEHDAYVTTTTYELTSDEGDTIQVVNQKKRTIVQILTGYATNVMTWVVLLIVAAAAIVFIRRRQNAAK